LVSEHHRQAVFRPSEEGVVSVKHSWADKYATAAFMIAGVQIGQIIDHARPSWGEVYVWLVIGMVLGLWHVVKYV
jgi:F0F1-type ATP synthase assembly protein I